MRLQIPGKLQVDSLWERTQAYLRLLQGPQLKAALARLHLETPKASNSLDSRDLQPFLETLAESSTPSVETCSQIALVYYVSSVSARWSFAKLHTSSAPIFVPSIDAKKLTIELYHELFPLTMAYIKTKFSPDHKICYVIIQPFKIGGTPRARDSRREEYPLLVEGPLMIFGLMSHASGIIHNHITDTSLLRGCLMALERSLSIIQNCTVSTDDSYDPGMPIKSFASISTYVMTKHCGGFWTPYINHSVDRNPLEFPQRDAPHVDEPVTDVQTLARYKFTGSTHRDFEPAIAIPSIERTFKSQFVESTEYPTITMRIDGSDVFGGLYEMALDGKYINTLTLPQWLTQQTSAMSLHI